MLLRHGLLGQARSSRSSPAASPPACWPPVWPRNATASWEAKSATRSGSSTWPVQTTRIKFVTEGILLRQMIQDPNSGGSGADLRRVPRAASVTAISPWPRAGPAGDGAAGPVDPGHVGHIAAVRSNPICGPARADVRRTHVPVDIEYALPPQTRPTRARLELAADAFARHVHTASPATC